MRPTLHFDPLLRAKSKRLKKEIALFIELMLSAENRLGLRVRSRRRKDLASFLLSSEALACNLLLTSRVSNAVLAVPRSHKMMWTKGRYRNIVYGKHFLYLLDLLKQLRLVSEITKGFRVSATIKQPTTIKPMRKFLREFSEPASDWFEQGQDDEILLLKSAKDVEGDSEPINYVETRKTKALRNDVRSINRTLASARISLVSGTGNWAFDTDRKIVWSHQRSVRRVFNNQSWKEGGRLFGGFWMNMEREERFRIIRIDGKKVANVDFSALFPRLAYGLKNIAAPRGDLYEYKEVTGDREGWKKLTNALLFAVKPLGSWPRETRQHFADETTLRKAVSAIKERHAAIATSFERGIGFQLMRIESDMLIRVLSRLSREGIVALPLHDSVLVAKPNAARAKSVMKAEFKMLTGHDAVVNIDE
jgi:hypothetical protein